MNRPLTDTKTFPFEETMNDLGSRQVPFLFVISYDKTSGSVIPLADVPGDLLYDLGGSRNYTEKNTESACTEHFDTVYSEHFGCAQYRLHRTAQHKLNRSGGSLKITDPVPFPHYRRAFETIIDEIRKGNTYVANLTFSTDIELDLSLKDIFMQARAPFKLFYRDEFVTFSPERFVRISENRIETFPMKGTIDATLPGAREKIIADKKEMAEHVMIVDLLRNDLSMVAKKVRVDRFRYIDEIETDSGPLLQVSSAISGDLDQEWQKNIGTIMMQLLPAGSITGAPKKSTVEIIDRAERDNRGFYTGVFGIFTGTGLDSAVMIRFIEKDHHGCRFRSGGGITIDSTPEKEYDELLRKVYLPF